MKPGTRNVLLPLLLAWLLTACSIVELALATPTAVPLTPVTSSTQMPLPQPQPSTAVPTARPTTGPVLPTRSPTAAAPNSPMRATATAARDTFPTIRTSQLPPEARVTLTLIEEDGPFPYRQDGVVFENREGLLPPRATGYYREYTVITPGSRDRGARRIISGDGGERYYTDDHYASFKRIIP